MLLMLDNYDSFTYNLVQYCMELGEQVEVYRNDKITVDEIVEKKPTRIIVSPGPCTPNEAGISVELIQRLAGQFPILGVCLGHQAIGHAFGGQVVRAPQLMHGKTSPVFHDHQGVFNGLSDPFIATRYHSLIVERDGFPDCLKVTAWTEEGEIMGLQHKDFPLWGVQFHPESILTVEGKQLLQNFLDLS